MATTPVLSKYTSGQTLTASIFPKGSDVPAQSGIALTEETNRKGVYRGNVTAAVAGWTTWHLFQAGNPVAVFDLWLQDSTDEYEAHDAPVQLHQGTPNNAVTEVNLDSVSAARGVLGGFGYNDIDILFYNLWLTIGGVRVTDFNTNGVASVEVKIQQRSAEIPFPTTPTIDNARGLITGSGAISLPDDDPLMAEVLVTMDDATEYKSGLAIVNVVSS